MTTVKLHLGEYTQDLESVVQDKDNEIAVETCPPPPFPPTISSLSGELPINELYQSVPIFPYTMQRMRYYQCCIIVYCIQELVYTKTTPSAPWHQ